MSVRARWGDETHTWILADLSLPEGRTSVTLEERTAPLFEAMALAGTVAHTVDLVVDMRLARVAPGGNWFSKLRQINAQVPGNLDLVIVVGSSTQSLISRSIAVVDSVAGLRANVKFVATMAEAEALLAREE